MTTNPDFCHPDQTRVNSIIDVTSVRLAFSLFASMILPSSMNNNNNNDNIIYACDICCMLYMATK